MAATVSKLLEHLKSVTPKEELIGLDEMATDPEKRSQQLECKANDDIEVRLYFTGYACLSNALSICPDKIFFVRDKKFLSRTIKNLS